VPDPHALDISLTLNGQVRQSSNTVNLIFSVPFLISHLSQTMTLLPGDIISTGTPGGVGMYSNPPVFLQPGDTVSVTIAGLGTLTNTIA
jgi:2-keto-4-pentenoate hydratase/2-oxohepta-3-ene-1,7-dioic acid hydratase in catechol pathway